MNLATMTSRKSHRGGADGTPQSGLERDGPAGIRLRHQLPAGLAPDDQGDATPGEWSAVDEDAVPESWGAGACAGFVVNDPDGVVKRVIVETTVKDARTEETILFTLEDKLPPPPPDDGGGDDGGGDVGGI